MEFLLARIYLVAIFAILLLSAIFLALQIQLRQNLEKTLVEIQSEPEKDVNPYENRFKLGQIYLRKKIYTKAIEEFSECAENWDKNDRLGLASVFNSLGFTYYQLDENQRAIEYYKTALELTPDYTTCLLNLGYAYKAQNQLEDLMSLVNQMTQYEPDHPKLADLELWLNRYK